MNSLAGNWGGNLKTLGPLGLSQSEAVQKQNKNNPNDKTLGINTSPVGAFSIVFRSLGGTCSSCEVTGHRVDTCNTTKWFEISRNFTQVLRNIRICPLLMLGKPSHAHKPSTLRPPTPLKPDSIDSLTPISFVHPPTGDSFASYPDSPASGGSCSKSSSSPRAAWYLVVTAKELWRSCVDGLVLRENPCSSRSEHPARRTYWDCEGFLRTSSGGPGRQFKNSMEI